MCLGHGVLNMKRSGRTLSSLYLLILSSCFFYPRLKTKVSTDASKNGLGAVLLQQHQQGWRPVSYAARGMTSAEERYAQIEKECLGITYGCNKFHQYIYGLPHVVLETDHKPLVALSNKSLNDMTPRLQRLMLKLQRYTFEVVWTPGKELCIADTLSRSNSSSNIRVVAEDGVRLQVNMVYEGLAASSAALRRIAEETTKDRVLCSVIECINGEWRKGQNPAYASFKEDLCVINGLLMKGDRIVIPCSMRKEMLALIHVGHLGPEKQKKIARENLFWPNINTDIDENIANCGVCMKYRKAQTKLPLLKTQDRKAGPWERVSMDLMTWEQKVYLVVVDSYSNYPEIAVLSSTTSEAIILQCKSIFARHGIPLVVCSDNGPQFAAATFGRFAELYGFYHETSSPYYPKSNGQAEKAVGIVKQLLNRFGTSCLQKGSEGDWGFPR